MRPVAGVAHQALRRALPAVGALWLLLVSSSLVAQSADACTGGPLLDSRDPAADSYEDVAEVIFTGTAVRRDDESGGVMASDPYYWTFVVDGVEKGDVGERFTVSSPRFDGSCGVTFRLGERYRVLAWGGGSPDRPQVTQGNGTQPLPPLPNPPRVEGEFEGSALFGLVLLPIRNPLAGILLIAGLGVAWWLMRRREENPTD